MLNIEHQSSCRRRVNIDRINFMCVNFICSNNTLENYFIFNPDDHCTELVSLWHTTGLETVLSQLHLKGHKRGFWYFTLKPFPHPIPYFSNANNGQDNEKIVLFYPSLLHIIFSRYRHCYLHYWKLGVTGNSGKERGGGGWRERHSDTMLNARAPTDCWT